MDDALRARDAARAALDDVEPARLRDALDDRLTRASMTPAVLTTTSARRLGPDRTADRAVDRAVGVQLIYEGLRLTRDLAQTEPWATHDEAGDIDADLDILVADVLVSRGFYLLARTETAPRAVEVIRAFGRDQTLRRRTGADTLALDRNLEADVFSLAVATGATAVDVDPGPRLLSYAADLARDYDGELLPVGVILAGGVGDALATFGADDRVPPATDS